MNRSDWNQRRLSRAGGYTLNPALDAEHYREPRAPHGPYWCRACEIEFTCPETLTMHMELRHEEARA